MPSATTITPFPFQTAPLFSASNNSDVASLCVRALPMCTRTSFARLQHIVFCQLYCPRTIHVHAIGERHPKVSVRKALCFQFLPSLIYHMQIGWLHIFEELAVPGRNGLGAASGGKVWQRFNERAMGFRPSPNSATFEKSYWCGTGGRGN